MSLTYASWPFKALTSLSIEERARWWNVCYSPAVLDVMGELPVWRIIQGGPGSGKSVLLAGLERQQQDIAVTIRYPPEVWPGGKHEWVAGGNHLAQIMACAGNVVREIIASQPNRINNLGNIQREFLRWLIERFNGKRAFERWIDTLPDPFIDQLTQVPYKDIFPETNQRSSVHGQIEELVSLIRRMGFLYIHVMIDLNESEAQKNARTLLDLFEYREIMEHSWFSVVVALPLSANLKDRAIEKAHGLASASKLSWELPKVREIADRHIHAALDRPETSLAAFIDAETLIQLEQYLLVEYGGFSPAGWVGLAETLLYLNSGDPAVLLEYPHPDAIEDIQRALFARHHKLRLDPDARGVWRGPRFIPLTDQLFGFISILFARQGAPVHLDDQALGALTKKKDILHTTAARVRQAIEPVPENPVYLINQRRQGGYVLKNFV